MPLSDFSPRVRRPVRRKANDAHMFSLFPFPFTFFSFFCPLSLRRRGRAPPLCLFPFRPLFLSFLVSRLRHLHFGAHVGGATLSCPLGATKFPLSTNKTPFSKILLFHACKLFLSEKIRTDSMTGEKKGDTFFPLSARDILYAECAATLSPARNRCVIS